MNLQDYTKAVDTYADSVYRVAYSYTYTKVDAEDVLQNVFLNYSSQDRILTVRNILRKNYVFISRTVCICRRFIFIIFFKKAIDSDVA